MALSTVKTYEDYALLLIDSEKFGHHEFILDKEDANKVGKYSWSVLRANKRKDWGTYYYASSCTCKKETGYALLHRFIMNAPKNKVIDHINRETHDMRKDNMRVCDRSFNCSNKKVMSNNLSGHRGIILNNYGTRKTPKWDVSISCNSHRIHLGYYDNLDDAIRARNEGEIKYLGGLIDDFCTNEQN